MKAFKLINIKGADCSFIEGTIEELKHIKANYFVVQTNIEGYQLSFTPCTTLSICDYIKG